MKKKFFLIVCIFVLIALGVFFILKFNLFNKDEFELSDSNSNLVKYLSSDLVKKYSGYAIIENRYTSEDIFQDIPYPNSIVLNGTVEISSDYILSESLTKVLCRLTDNECQYKLDRIIDSNGTEQTYEDINYTEDFFQEIINSNKDNLTIVLSNQTDDSVLADYIYIIYNENFYESGSSLVITAQSLNDNKSILLVYDDNKSLEYPHFTSTEIVRSKTYAAQSK